MLKDNMELQPENNKKSIWPWVAVILIAAWFIAMAILGAGMLISREIAKQYKAADSGIASSGPIDIEVPAGLPVLGNNNAPVTVIEFADFQCPFCGEWKKTILPELKAKYIDTGKVRLVYMDFPFLGAESYSATKAARCALDQNKFWEYHDKLYDSQAGENEGAFADEKLIQFASDVGLDTPQFKECFNSQKYQSYSEESLQKGTGYGVNSTPTVFVNGFKVEGLVPAQSYWQLIETELAK